LCANAIPKDILDILVWRTSTCRFPCYRNYTAWQPVGEVFG
jgi:hypothetical protein